MKRQDQRSVGELLLDADFTTRHVLMDVTGQDAPAMLRTWGEVVQSAAELWATLPPPVGGGAVDRAGATSDARGEGGPEFGGGLDVLAPGAQHRGRVLAGDVHEDL